MLPISKDKVVPTRAPVIVGSYTVLHYDEQPILYTGTNEFGAWVIGSFVEDDDEAQIARYFHTVVDFKTYFAFVNRRRTYYDVMKASPDVYVIDRSFDGTSYFIYHIPTENIPEDYLPSRDSFCPDLVRVTGPRFVLKLRGKWADSAAADPREVAKVQNVFANIAEAPYEALPDLDLEQPEVQQLAYAAGSFELNFNVRMRDKKGNLFLSENSVYRYASNFIEYCLKHLPAEVDAVYGGGTAEEAKHFQDLVVDLKALYSESQKQFSDGSVEHMRTQIKKASEHIVDLSQSVGEHFSEIELFNQAEDHEIGLIDESYRIRADETLEAIQKHTGDEIKEDPTYLQYEIHVYHLNVQSRSGNAFIYIDPERVQMSRPKITILGEEDLVGSKFTESLHADKWIKVSARAKRVGDKVKSLEIEFG